MESDGKYHLFVARWREDNPRGHAGWPDSEIVQAVSDRPTGPFVVKQVIGPGHFPEIHRLKDDEYVIYHFHGCYTAGSLEGPWKHLTRKELGFPKATFGSLAVREDGSLLMLDRIMRVWIKENGSDEFQMVSGRPVQPRKIPGSYEDPMVWRTEVQYHAIVNDWLGRTAYHFRSKDGVNWTMDPGEAYTIDFDGYEDGTKVGWYKYERPKVLQDQYGRATHLYLAVIDVPKKQDLSKDNHSSKNIVLPLVVGRRLQILNTRQDHRGHQDDPFARFLRRKASILIRMSISIPCGSAHRKQVDFGGGCKPIKSEKSGKDLIVTFDAAGNGITDDNFAAKLIGKTAGASCSSATHACRASIIHPMSSGDNP